MEKSEIALRNMISSLAAFAGNGVPGSARAGEILRQWDRERGTCLAVFPSCNDGTETPVSKETNLTIEVSISNETIIDLLKKSDVRLADLIKHTKGV